MEDILQYSSLCCPLYLIVGADTRVRMSYKDEELELTLPFGSQSRLFLCEVNKAWSGRSNYDYTIVCV